MNEFLLKPVQYLKGMGPKRAAVIQKLDIYSTGDLLYYFPRKYHDRTQIQPAHSYSNGQVATIMGKVLYSQEINPRRGLTIVKIAMDDGCGIFQGVWFNQKYVIKQYPPGTTLLVVGKIDNSFNGQTQLHVTECEVVDDLEQSLNGGRIVPVYSLTEGITQRVMRLTIQRALEQIDQLQEFLPSELLNKYRLPSIKEALQSIHFPKDQQDAQQARRRFIFEELLLVQLKMVNNRHRSTLQKKSHTYISVNDNLVNKLLNNLPFKPTLDQEKVWREINEDMDNHYPMARLLQGDVGSGKTLVSALVLTKAADSGFQGALMAPTEILAEQHYLSLSRWLTPLGIKVALITSGIKKSLRKQVLEDVSQGHVQVVIGTHALIQGEVSFKKLAVVVVDEQHRFGVKQRLALQDKGILPDMLVMTATPIPRTLALTVYGDLDMSVIYELPPGRKPVRTYHVTPESMDAVFKLIKGEVKRGRQAYIVCPLVEESETLDVQAAVDLAAEISRKQLSDLRIGLMHGRLSSEEKDRVMSDFRDGSIDVLVSTTVIEVGVDIPNSNVMIIIDADRFGLAQLHQLRGRVGRGAHQSFCILVSTPKTDEGKKRIEAMVNSADGFALAEEDLKLRGPGEFLGVKQSGLPEFKIADIIRDRKALECARREAELIMSKDPELHSEGHQMLHLEMMRRFEKKNIHVS